MTCPFLSSSDETCMLSMPPRHWTYLGPEFVVGEQEKGGLRKSRKQLGKQAIVNLWMVLKLYVTDHVDTQELPAAAGEARQVPHQPPGCIERPHMPASRPSS